MLTDLGLKVCIALIGESWHLIPAAELGAHRRSLCGAPRQGTRLSETYAEVRPQPPEEICTRCVAAQVTKV